MRMIRLDEVEAPVVEREAQNRLGLPSLAVVRRHEDEPVEIHRPAPPWVDFPPRILKVPIFRESPLSRTSPMGSESKRCLTASWVVSPMAMLPGDQSLRVRPLDGFPQNGRVGARRLPPS